MFSDEFNTFLVNTVLSYKELGYKDYFCYSTLYKNDIESYMEYFIVVSKDSISYSNNSFHLGADSKVISVTGPNNQVSSYDCDSSEFVVDDCLFLTSNAKDFVGTDSMQFVDYNSQLMSNTFEFDYSSLETLKPVSVDYTPFYLINTFLAIILLYIWFRDWFGKNYE